MSDLSIPFVNVFVAVCITITIVSIGLILNKLILRPFLRIFTRDRKRIRQIFVDMGFKPTTLTVEQNFDHIYTRVQYLSLYLIIFGYKSWLYRGIKTICEDVYYSERDFLSTCSGVVVIGELKKEMHTSDKNKNEKKDVRMICEAERTCDYRTECQKATPSKYNGYLSFECSFATEQREMVNYEPTKDKPYVRCAAAMVGSCKYTECKHYHGHFVLDSCPAPHKNTECKLRDNDHERFRDLNRRGLIHCIIYDCTVDINISFKRKKRNV